MKLSIKYACQHCNQVVTGEYEGFLSATTILICDRCDKGTLVRLYRPLDYEAEERVRQTQ
jgi:hypothetical protein